MFGLGVMVRVSSRAKTTQEATQLGGAVILPLIFLALGQASGILLLDLPVAFAIGLAAFAVIALPSFAVRVKRDTVKVRFVAISM